MSSCFVYPMPSPDAPSSRPGTSSARGAPSWNAGERWAMPWAEYGCERAPKGFYGFGFVDYKTSRHSASGRKAAR